MTRRLFGHTSIEVPIIGQGTWQMGAARDRAAEIATLREGLRLGLTHIDTAEMYGDGRAEEMVAEALAGAGVRREDVFLASKVIPRHASYQGTLRACEGSLRRLRTGYLDLYLLHWPGEQPIAETMRAFEELVKQGKIRLCGVSNCDVRELDEARAALTSQKLACNQVLYHLGERAIEHRILPYCEQHGIALVGYSPFGSSGGFPAEGSRAGRALAAVAARHGVTIRQVALAYLTRRAPTFTIPKASTIEHVRDNAGALALRLHDDDVRAIEAEFPLGRSAALPTL